MRWRDLKPVFDRMSTGSRTVLVYADALETRDVSNTCGKWPPPWEGWSEWQDLNPPPPRPERGAPPGCATPPLQGRSYRGALIPSQAQAAFCYSTPIAALSGPPIGPLRGC